jgi:NDP-sugar pyrophosphorylase family protein
MDLSSYRAIILAGGKGTRLYPITKEIPKPLLPVKRRPIINYLVDLFSKAGIKNIAVLINGFYREDFEWWKKRYYPDLDINFTEESEPLGTFGGLYLLKDWIGNNPFFVTNGDEIKEINLSEMAKFHFSQNILATICSVYVPDPKNYGVIICKNKRVKEFLEKPENPTSNYVNSGLYLFSPEILKNHPGPKFLMTEKDVFPVLAKENKLANFQYKGYWADCGTWKKYGRALSS